MGTTVLDGAFVAWTAGMRICMTESGTGITPVRDVDYTHDALNRLIETGTTERKIGSRASSSSRGCSSTI